MNKKAFESVVLEISKLNLGENDYLAVKFPQGSSTPFLEHALETFREHFPELKVLLFVGDVKFEAIHKE